MKRFECQFVGGEYNGITVPMEEVMTKFPVTGYTEDLTEIRNRGGVCHRAELDNKPIVSGYLSPMYNGCRVEDFTDVICIRYETQEVYDMLSR